MSLDIKIVERISALDESDVNALAEDDPFASYEFYNALENSGSV